MNESDTKCDKQLKCVNYELTFGNKQTVIDDHHIILTSDVYLK